MHNLEEAIEEIRQGNVVIVVDHEDRESEGDMICASECITPEIVNLMVKERRGLICVSLTEERCQVLNLPLMVSSNTAAYQTAFTVSVDLKGDDCGTGISVHDQAKTSCIG